MVSISALSTARVILIAGIWDANTKSQQVAGVAEVTGGTVSTGGGGAGEGSHEVVEARASGVGD